MSARFFPLASTLAWTLIAGAASAAMPASGEGPFFNDPIRGPSDLTRAEVMAMAIQSPPASGEGNGSQTTAPTPQPVDRETVVAELRDALAQGFRPATGDIG